MPVLQVNFKLQSSTAEYEQICQSVAQVIADVPGLRWKVWLLNEQEKEAGGIYLFDTQEAVNDYLASPIVTQIKSHPALADISVKQFDVMPEVTAVTRGPVSVMTAGA